MMILGTTEKHVNGLGIDLTAIITSKKGVLSTEIRPSTIINAPIDIVEKLELCKDLLEEYKNLKKELEEINEKNIKLALSRKELQTKYNQILIEYQTQIKMALKYFNELKELTFNFYCSELKKEISIIDCNKACKDKICIFLYECSNRIEAIKTFFQIL